MIGADGLVAVNSTTVAVEDLIGLEHDLLRPEEAQRAALKYISLGWAVTTGPGLDSAGVCSCKAGVGCRNPGKHARAGWGNDKRITMTAEQAETHFSAANPKWKDKPVDQVFIVPYLSGLVVADVDNEAAWAGLDAEQRPETLWQASGSGRGGHRLYRYDWDLELKDPPSLPGKLPGSAGELKFRGIIAAAPSMHPSGGRYRWSNWGAELAPAPARLLEKCDRWKAWRDPERVVTVDLADRWARLQFLADCAEMDGVSSARTSRPLVLFAKAASMAGWIGTGWISESEVISRLMSAAHCNGAIEKYGEADIRRQIRNGIHEGLTSRGERR